MPLQEVAVPQPQTRRSDAAHEAIEPKAPSPRERPPGTKAGHPGLPARLMDTLERYPVASAFLAGLITGIVLTTILFALLLERGNAQGDPLPRPVPQEVAAPQP